MEYIIITLLAIAATTFIIYILANKVFGVLLRLRSLVLCAVCALIISVVLPRIVVSFAGLAGTVGFLAVFAVIFAYLVAYYDDPNDLQPAPEAAASSAALQPAESEAPSIAETVSELPVAIESPVSLQLPLIAESPAVEPLSVIASELVSAAEETVSATQETVALPAQPILAIASDMTAIQPYTEMESSNDFAGLVFGTVTGENQEPQPELDQLYVSDDAYLDREEAEPVVSVPYLSINRDPESPFLPVDEPESDQEDLLADPLLEMAHLVPFIPIVAEPEQISQTAVETAPVSQAEPEAKVASKSKAKSKAKTNAVTEPEQESPTADLMTPVSDPKPDMQQLASDPATTSRTVNETPAPEYTLDILPAAENLPEDLEVTAITTSIDLSPVSDSLDDLLDFAFQQKEHHNHPLALDSFRQALKLYQDSDAAPYIAIEIAALLKDRGAYDEAILILTHSRTLPGLLHNEPLSQEFITTIAYLRIVKNILLESRMGYLPFSSIPTEVSQEIDAEFREWRNLA